MLRLIILSAMLAIASPSGATEAGWALLRDGEHVVLLRHAMAPGTSEPANFEMDKCSTQRGLSERGREQARRLGALIDARAAPTEKVLSSRYCRTRETARLAFGSFEDFAALDPPPADPAAAKVQMSAVMDEIRNYSGSGNLILVTHLETIQALTGRSAREGEALIVQPQGDGLHVMGSVLFN